MKIIKFLAFTVLILSFTSCAIHSGMMTGNAAISDGNFKVVKVATGTAKATKVFGLGGLGKDALVFEAKKNLLTNYPLKEGQALANVTVDFKNSFIIIINVEKVTVTADIVEFQ